MNIPDDWPTDCPPADAAEAEGNVFRIVNGDPPTEFDMRSHREMGTRPKDDACLRCGLSTFREIEDAVDQALLFPNIGK